MWGAMRRFGNLIEMLVYDFVNGLNAIESCFKKIRFLDPWLSSG